MLKAAHFMPLLGNMMCRNVDKNLQVPEMYLPNLDAQLLTVWEEFTDEQTDREISCIVRSLYWFYNSDYIESFIYL